MKTLKLSLGLILMVLCTGSFAKDTLNTRSVFKLDVKVKTAIHDLEGLRVDLYERNRLVQTITPSRKGNLTAKLQRDQYYTLEIRMPGFYTKRIAFSTYVSDAIVVESVFKFDVYLVANEALTGVDVSVLDFPGVQASHDKDETGVKCNESHTREPGAEHELLLLEAQLRKRYAMTH